MDVYCQSPVHYLAVYSTVNGCNRVSFRCARQQSTLLTAKTQLDCAKDDLRSSKIMGETDSVATCFHNDLSKTVKYSRNKSVNWVTTKDRNPRHRVHEQ